jgi:hypothetical protein
VSAFEYHRVSATEWTWARDGKQFSAHIFPQTRRVVWAAWVETGEGPRFDPGFSQTYDSAMISPAPGYDPPPGVMDEINAAIKKSAASGRSRRLFGRQGR